MKVIDSYTLIQVIGEGNYGTVYRAKHKLKSQEFAVKSIPIDKFYQHEKLSQCTNNEIKVLTTIGTSQFIIRYYELIKTKNNYYFVYEFCDGGTLMDKLKIQQFLPQKKALQIFRSLLEAFKILNKNNIMHRDLKPENIFFSQDKVKLGDFGFCKGFKPEENLAKTMLGSPIYMAPEVLKGQPYTSKADIWSLGVILYEMVFGFCPFQSNSIAMLISTIDSKPLSIPEDKKVSDKTIKLIKKMLTKDYFTRISWVELFSVHIDIHGHYIEDSQYSSPVPERLTQTYKEQKTYSFLTPESVTNNNSVEQTVSAFGLKGEQSKKTVSVPKQEKSRKFYSQNYMSIFEKPINKKEEEKKHEKKGKLKASPGKDVVHSMNSIPLSGYRNHEEVEYENWHQKMDEMIKIHEKCMKSLEWALKLLEKKGKEVLSDCYVLLRKVSKKLRLITQGVKITETNLLDMATVVNYEIIQVERLFSEMKKELQNDKIPVPKIQENVLSSSSHNTSINPEIKKCVQLLQ